VKAGDVLQTASLRSEGQGFTGGRDGECGKTVSVKGIYKVLNRHDKVCSKPRPKHIRLYAAAAKTFKRHTSFCGQG